MCLFQTPTNTGEFVSIHSIAITTTTSVATNVIDAGRQTIR